MQIPDCRTDEYYNEKYLNETDSECISGYDFSIKDNIENFFANIGLYEDELSDALGRKLSLDKETIALSTGLDGYTDKEKEEMSKETAFLIVLKECMKIWAESNRDEFITSLIENMKESEYEELKAKADCGEYKNAIIRQREYEEKMQKGEIPTCWRYEKDKDGNLVKKGYCPNGDIIVETE